MECHLSTKWVMDIYSTVGGLPLRAGCQDPGCDSTFVTYYNKSNLLLSGRSVPFKIIIKYPMIATKNKKEPVLKHLINSILTDCILYNIS